MTRYYTGSCHCNAVEFEVDTDLTTGLQCDCSLCKRKNIVMHRVPRSFARLMAMREASRPCCTINGYAARQVSLA